MVEWKQAALSTDKQQLDESNSIAFWKRWQEAHVIGWRFATVSLPCDDNSQEGSETIYFVTAPRTFACSNWSARWRRLLVSTAACTDKDMELYFGVSRPQNAKQDDGTNRSGVVICVPHWFDSRFILETGGKSKRSCTPSPQAQPHSSFTFVDSHNEQQEPLVTWH